MRKGVWLLLLSSFILSGCNLSLRKSGVEIITYPKANVYIDGKEAGQTPYKNNSLKAGEISVKLDSGGLIWERKIHLESGANTVINWEFNKDMDTSGGYILYFEATGDNKKAGMLISSKPDRTAVALDDEIKGYSPIRLDNIGDGDKKLTVSSPGYKSISSFVKFVNGYQLVIKADLAKESEVVVPTENIITASESTESGDMITGLVTIKETETGWLRVRSEPSNSAEEVAKVKPSERHPLIKETEGWYLINLGTGKSGWVSSKYAEKS